MDILVSNKKHTPYLKVLVLTAVLMGAFVWLMMQPNAQQRIASSDFWSGQVQQGDLQLQVSGYGRLKSKTPRLLTAQSNATVEEIVLKPGALVTPDSVILRLSDPLVSQALIEAKRLLNQSNNQFLQLKINQQRELLAQQAQLETLRSALESADLQVNAQSQLIANGIVSNIEFQRSLLEQRQLTRRLEIEQQRIAQLAQLHQANLAIAQSNTEAQQAVLAQAQTQQERLTVTAGITGVVQSLHVDLGQTVSFGQQLVLVGSTTDLYALLNVPQATMQQVELGQVVTINTRAGVISGAVSRIDPVINNGSVQVEVALTSLLTANARPELNIEGIIETGVRRNVLFIDKPVNVSPFSEATLFLLNEEKDSAMATHVQFGEQTNDKIEIVAGAKLADQFILSDMSRWLAFSTLTVI
ncbi:efflux RND transporter periplasmic adaptor subunit [Pseudoalteromonas tunicata]|uniref:HlyD family secretion protein n=1 Tax=Pseudoalteromonas tunicata TaxID=314281 RepID=UPI00273E93D3|nr:efflux RND transporter periplasmic adaptor subunit [Pseudoalteromonas tunicata]MDP5215453.1 efflux RND transporter periplasmic adaptor subunit [Pseudoalteromonas tunicata]